MGASGSVAVALADIVTSSPLTAVIFVPGGMPGPLIVAPTPNGPGPAENPRLPDAMAGVERNSVVLTSGETPNGVTVVMTVPDAIPGPLIDWPSPKAPVAIERPLISLDPSTCVPLRVAVTTSVSTVDPVVIVAVPLATFWLVTSTLHCSALP